MNSLGDLANRVAKDYDNFVNHKTAEWFYMGDKCSYNPKTNAITLNFSWPPDTNLKKFKLMHELAHRNQREEENLYGNTTLIELNANKIAVEACKKSGIEIDNEIVQHVNYNNMKHLDPGMSDNQILKRILGLKEIIWRL